METHPPQARRAKKLLLVAVAALWALPSQASGDINGFLREKRHGDVAFSFSDESFDRFWLGSTKVDVPNGGDFKTRSLSLWVAYGITDNLTVTADLPYVDAESNRFASIGSTGGAKHEFLGGFGIRTIASNYDVPGPVDIGDGTADWLFRFVYQLTYKRFYFSQQAGFDLRSGAAPNGFPFYTEAGWTQGPATYSALYSRLDARGGTDIGAPNFLTFPGNKKEYQRLGGKAFVRLTDVIGVSGMAYTTLTGRNVGDSSGFSVGIDFRY